MAIYIGTGYGCTRLFKKADARGLALRKLCPFFQDRLPEQKCLEKIFIEAEYVLTWVAYLTYECIIITELISLIIL
jgi:hypothetical protein